MTLYNITNNEVVNRRNAQIIADQQESYIRQIQTDQKLWSAQFEEVR